jgi:hypothetical protein
MQFRWGLDEPLKRTKDGRIDVGGAVLDFLSEIPKYSLWETVKMQAEDAELHSQVIAWRSRWMPVANNASIRIQPAETKPELEKPKQILPSPTKNSNGSSGIKNYESELKKLIQKGLLENEENIKNPELLIWMERSCNDDDVRRKLKSKDPKKRRSIQSEVSLVRKDMGRPAPQ